MVSNTYCVVFLFCLSSSCVPYIASFSGLSILIASSVFSNIYYGKRCVCYTQSFTVDVETHPYKSRPYGHQNFEHEFVLILQIRKEKKNTIRTLYQINNLFWLDKPHHDIVVSVLVSSVVDHRFKLQSGQTKDYKICICCFYAKYTVLRSKSKDWLTQNQCVWVEWHLLFQWIITNENPTK